MSDELEPTSQEPNKNEAVSSRPSGNSEFPIAARDVAPRQLGPPAEASSQPREAAASTGGFSNYLHAFRRRWFSAIALGLVGAVAAAIAAWVSATTTFTSTALIRISATDHSLLFKVDDSHSSFDIYKGTQIQLLTSDYVLTAALRNLPNYPILRQQEDPLRWLSRSLQTDTAENSEIVHVALTASDANEAKDILQHVINAYKTEVVDKEQMDRERRLQALEDVYTQKRTELGSQLTQFSKLQSELGNGDNAAPSPQQQMELQELVALRTELDRIRGDLETARAKLSDKLAAAKARQNQPPSAVDIDGLAAKDPECMRILLRLANIDDAIEEIRQKAKGAMAKLEIAPYLLQRNTAEEQLQQRRMQLAEQQKTAASPPGDSPDRGIQELQFQIARLADREDKKAKDLDAKEKLFLQHGKPSIDVRLMGEGIKELEAVLKAAADEQQHLRVELNSPVRIQPFQDATLPIAPDKSSRLQNAATFGLLGFLAPIGLLLWWDVRGQRINSVHDVTNRLGLPVIGSVPRLPVERFVRNQASRRHRQMQISLDQSIDAIAAKLFLQREEGRAHVVLVSSATRGEGKSTLSIQLAKRLARTGAATLLVDFDLRKPALHAMFDAPRGPGLTEYLRGKSELEPLIRESGVENLSMLTAGSPFADSLGALSNGVTKSLFAVVRDEFDFVIVDGTPILPVVDALLIGQHVDSVILSMRRDVSQIHRVRAACERLSAFGVEDFAAVLTGTSDEPYDYGDAESPESALEEKTESK